MTASPAKPIHRRAIYPTVDTCRCGCQDVKRTGTAKNGWITRLCAACGEWRKVAPLIYVVTYAGEPKSRLCLPENAGHT